MARIDLHHCDTSTLPDGLAARQEPASHRSDKLADALVCPECHGSLQGGAAILTCAQCDTTFPISAGIPVLLPSWSVFSPRQVLESERTYYASKRGEAPFKQRFRKALPKVSGNPNPGAIVATIRSHIENLPSPRCGLEIGTGESPALISSRYPAVSWLTSDVDLAYRPDLVADVTGLPLADETMDIVYADNVLEHVMDIGRAAREMERVCRVGGLIVALVPFMYPWHGIPYDFYRFTPCGLRVLFPQTEILLLERVSGAWAALALQLDSRLVSAFRQKYARAAAVVASRFLFSGLKQIDRLASAPRHLVSAAGMILIGRKLRLPLSSKAIMAEMRDRYGSLP